MKGKTVESLGGHESDASQIKPIRNGAFAAFATSLNAMDFISVPELGRRCHTRANYRKSVGVIRQDREVQSWYVYESGGAVQFLYGHYVTTVFRRHHRSARLRSFVSQLP